MSSHHHTAVATILLASVYVPSAGAFDAAGYHTANCSRCHDTSVYTREDRKILSYPMLQSRVRGCDARFGEKLAAEELNGLVDHLNDSYYKFDK